MGDPACETGKCGGLRSVYFEHGDRESPPSSAERTIVGWLAKWREADWPNLLLVFDATAEPLPHRR